MQTLIRINLLDWREARREQRKKQFLTALGVAALGALGLVALGVFAYNSAIDSQQARNRFLQAEIAEIDKQIAEIEALEQTRDNLITRMRIIEELQQSRSQIVHYFDQIVETLPEGVYLTSLKQNGKTTTVNGIAESNGRVSAYMVNLDASAWFDDPRLVVIKGTSGGSQRAAEFTLNFRTVNPQKPDDEGGQSEAEAP
ncbi:PilN domain-containing protein [Spectribacter hydrogenoxidans]|uniref:PilN domain-containing protein n=1 Tax=Spectribacter hydrogenoxidans TaxID=3075608 RepID=A0ABU3C0D2_9GAMM|nr:PilN domain-containing protein [Salinisphaera sp. W335]MDT0634819.1 PilN domain-containing protein [Salinisphaera sp. W335]